MIFCGDTVLSAQYAGGTFEVDSTDFWKKPKILNFESSINLGNLKRLTPGIALQSDESVIQFFEDFEEIFLAIYSFYCEIFFVSYFIGLNVMKNLQFSAFYVNLRLIFKQR